MNLQDCPDGLESISALADGQLRGAEFARAVEVLAEDADARAAWHAYHVAGDVLRSGELARGAADAAFVERLQQRLRLEPGPPSLASPGHAAGATAAGAAAPSSPWSRTSASANDPGRRWQWAGAFALALGAAVIGWSAMPWQDHAAQQMAQIGPAPMIGTTPGSAVAADNSAPVMLRDPHLDALLMAHKQFGGTSALQMPTGFLRNATFEGAAR